MNTLAKSVINHSLNQEPLISLNSQTFLKIGTICYTILMFFLLSCNIPVKSQSINNTENIDFYGDNSFPLQSGGNYLVFEQNGNQIKGLIYVQDSDDFSCINGIYNNEANQIENITFSFPEMGTDYWETYHSEEPLDLRQFPYQLNYQNIHESANSLFLYCLER